MRPTSAHELGEQVLGPDDAHAGDLAERKQMPAVAAYEHLGIDRERCREDPIVAGIATSFSVMKRSSSASMRSGKISSIIPSPARQLSG